MATTLLDAPLGISHNTLLQVHGLEKRFLPLKSIFASLQTVLASLQRTVQASCNDTTKDDISLALTNCANEAQAYADNAQYLLRITHSTRQQISDTLNFKNQDTMQGQSRNVLWLAEHSAQDSVSIRVITFLTMGYLPFSFIAVRRNRVYQN